MSYVLEVCLIALTLSTTITSSVGAHPQATAPAAQDLRAGISVELAFARNAAPVPEADHAGSLIVAVTRNGGVFLGIKPIRSAALAESIKAGRSRKIGNKVYIKADARTRYANVAKVLDAVRTAGDESAVVLLTGQRGTPNPGTPNPGTPLPPYGLVAQMGVPSGNGSRATVLQLLDSGRLSPQLQINDQPIPWIDLQSSLRRVLPKSKNKVVLVKADGSLPYADVVRLIDACHSLGARAHLETRGR